LVSKVGINAGIPMDNVIDTEKLIKMQNKNTMADSIHPNEKGYGILAQEIYMKLAYNKELKERINLIFESQINLKEW
jgi:lysophospholipase L1-like esterase